MRKTKQKKRTKIPFNSANGLTGPALNWVGLFSLLTIMNERVRRDTIAIALNNLIESINLSLEDNEICPNNAEDREYLEFLAASAATIIKEMADTDNDLPISKPKWDELTKR